MKYIASILTIVAFLQITKTSAQDNFLLNLQDSSITYTYAQEGDSIPSIKNIYVRINDTTNIIEQTYNKGNWQNRKKTRFHIGPETIYEITYYWINRTWEPSSYYIKYYNGKQLSRSQTHKYIPNSHEWICDSQTEHYYNNDLKDSILYYEQLNNELALTRKDIYTNCYNRPIFINYLIRNKKRQWESTGKTEYTYNEDEHSIIETKYTFKNAYILDRKVLIDTDARGNIVYKEILKWEQDKKTWHQESLFTQKDLDNNFYPENSLMLTKNKSEKNLSPSL